MYLINSPIVRAESLKFQESGVLGVVKEVFLPLYNAVQFFVQNVERWEANSTKKFSPSTDKVRATTNPTDVWISAATQGLINSYMKKWAVIVFTLLCQHWFVL